MHAFFGLATKIGVHSWEVPLKKMRHTCANVSIKRWKTYQKPFLWPLEGLLGQFASHPSVCNTRKERRVENAIWWLLSGGLLRDRYEFDELVF